MISTRVMAALSGVAFAFFGQAYATEPLVQGLDHMPLAVNDLDAAATNFGKLGFTIKPGRPHNDGVRNKQIKFPNYQAIELITASNPTDALAREYVDWLKGGDGPAFWAISSADVPALMKELAARHLEPVEDGVVTFSQVALPHRFFLGKRLPSPTDGPQYWTHPNTAYELKSLWIVTAAEEEKLLVSLGAAHTQAERCAPFTPAAPMLRFPDATEVMTVRGIDRPKDRALIGATVMVRSVAKARELLDANHVPYTTGCGGPSVWVAPITANGLWLELRE